MADDVVVRVSHKLGVEQITRRLRAVLDQVQTNYSQILKLTDIQWSDGRVTFVAAALGQTIRGAIEIQANYVELRATLPFLLRMFSKQINAAVQENSVKLLN